MIKGQYTPWGAADYVKQLGDSGIFEVGTPSHGGIYVPDHLVEAIPQSHQARAIKWSGSRNWYEEDCEWASVVVAFPHLFTSEQLGSAQLGIMMREGLEAAR